MTKTGASDGFSLMLREAASELNVDPALAARRAREVLASEPREPRARLVLGAALRRSRDLVEARKVLEPLARAQPASAPAQLELGLVLEALNETAAAADFVDRAISLNPRAVEAWRARARLMARSGDLDGAVAALRACLDEAPTAPGAIFDLAALLHGRQDDGQVLALAETLAAGAPNDDAVRGLLAACSARVGDYDRAASLFRDILDRDPDNPNLWLSLGHALRAQGERREAVGAYRRCLALAPGFGEAYWSLANLKSSRFSDDDEAALRSQLGEPDLPKDDRLHLHYALGRLLEQARRFDESFTHYAAGAAICRRGRPYNADAALSAMSASRHDFSPAILKRAATPHPAAGPIFVVGLPRAGSTLIEQILASHSEVEGCGEMPTMIDIARRVASEAAASYPACVARLGPSQLAAVGDRYMADTRIYRREGRARFVDKMPNNFHHLALIRLALPHARIIDARRAPISTGFSLFKQHFAAGHAFSYDLGDIGRYYQAYTALMSHYERIMPGAVLRVDYERMVLDTEAEVRRLLEFCGLGFEPGCLAFYANDRAVRTASSEQVRQPIYTEGLEQWRCYQPWLGPLEEALAFPL